MSFGLFLSEQSLFKDLLAFILYLYIYVYECFCFFVCMGTTEAREGIGFPGIEVMYGCEPTYGC